MRLADAASCHDYRASCQKQDSGDRDELRDVRTGIGYRWGVEVVRHGDRVGLANGDGTALSRVGDLIGLAVVGLVHDTLGADWEGPKRPGCTVDEGEGFLQHRVTVVFTHRGEAEATGHKRATRALDDLSDRKGLGIESFGAVKTSPSESVNSNDVCPSHSTGSPANVVQDSS